MVSELRINKKQLSEKITSLTSMEHEEILKIIKRARISYSKNKNGYFFNISSVDENTLKLINNFVDYTISNVKDLDLYEKRINECKILNNYQILNPPKISTDDPHLSNDTNKSNMNDWSNIEVETKNLHKLINFTDKIFSNREKIKARKITLLYNNSKKRWSKHHYSERKFDDEFSDELTNEEFLLS